VLMPEIRPFTTRGEAEELAVLSMLMTWRSCLGGQFSVRVEGVRVVQVRAFQPRPPPGERRGADRVVHNCGTPSGRSLPRGSRGVRPTDVIR
jgi:hypothetical protein